VVADSGNSWPFAVRVLVGVGAALLLAAASYSFVERPALRFKRQVRSRRPVAPMEPQPSPASA
jgi:peptidoglycan/LPS O-acetylase OafA/YrhL